MAPSRPTKSGVEKKSCDVTLNATEELEGVIAKNTVFEAPPPGAGLRTLTAVVAAVATSAASMAAVNCDLLTKVVVRALPFQLTTELGTKPVPLTVSVNGAPPGVVALGLSG